MDISLSKKHKALKNMYKVNIIKEEEEKERTMSQIYHHSSINMINKMIKEWLLR